MGANSSCDDWDTYKTGDIYIIIIMSVQCTYNSRKTLKGNISKIPHVLKNIHLENQFFLKGSVWCLDIFGDSLVQILMVSPDLTQLDREKYFQYFLLSAFSLNLFGLELIRSLISSSDDLTRHIISSNIVICITGTSESYYIQNLLLQ